MLPFSISLSNTSNFVLIHRYLRTRCEPEKNEKMLSSTVSLNHHNHLYCQTSLFVFVKMFERNNTIPTAFFRGFVMQGKVEQDGSASTVIILFTCQNQQVDCTINDGLLFQTSFWETLSVLMLTIKKINKSST